MQIHQPKLFIYARLLFFSILVFILVNPYKNIIAQDPGSLDPFADSVVDYQIFGAQNEHSDPNTVLGSPCTYGDDLSLGGGWVIVDMGPGEEILDREGSDLLIYESELGCNGGEASPYEVFVSNVPDGSWVSIGQGRGATEFDLTPSGLASARYVRIEDRSSGQPNNTDSTPGADIDAVKAVHWSEPSYSLVESIIIPATGSPVVSNVVLDDNRFYTVVITGTYRYDVGEPGEFADAQYREDDNDQWAIHWNSVEFDDIRLTADIFNLNQHSYTYHILGKNQPLTLRIYDDPGAYNDNQGNLNVTIYSYIPSDNELVAKYSPYFYLHQEEIYAPMSVDLALQHAEILVNQEDQSQNTSPPITTETLASDEWRKRKNSYVDFKGVGREDVEGYYKTNIQNSVDPTVYARIFKHSSGRKVIQYWIFYYDNPWKIDNNPFDLRNYHEGDWEMIQVLLDNDGNPIMAAYSQHSKVKFIYEFLEGGSKRLWDYILKDGSHPLVYPGRGSHASYFVPYNHLGSLDTAGPPSAEITKPAIEFLPVSDSEDSWLYYQGSWGEVTGKFHGDGPRGPVNQNPVEKWSDPVVWLDLIPWDELANHHLAKYRFWVTPPLDVGVMNDATGQRVGWFGDTLYQEIESGEYIDNKVANRRTVIVHDSGFLDRTLITFFSLRLPTNVTSSSLFNDVEAVIEYPQEDDTIARITYTIPIEGWTTDTQAQVILDPASDFILKVDLDNNGSADAEVIPTVEIMKPFERKVYLPFMAR